MSAPSSSLGNVLSRLQGLKNLSGDSTRRRVMPGAGILAEEEELPDVQGTASPLPNFANFAPPTANQPEPDMGGELTPQSYDVRANTVENPEAPQEQEGFWSRFGRALALQTHNAPTPKPQAAPVSQPPIETAQVEASEGLNPEAPPMGAGGESPNSTFWSSIGNALKEYVQPFGTADHTFGKGEASGNKRLIENAQMKTQGITNPDDFREKTALATKAAEATVMQGIEEAQKEPMAHIVYGATDLAAQQPDLQEKFREITGEDFTEEKAEQTAKYEKVIADLEANNDAALSGYDEQMNRIRERIESNNATDMDKYYVGLALLMPVLLGAIFGKEVGLGALGGGAKGVADVFGNRIKNQREDEQLLSDVGKLKGQNELRKSELELEKLKIPSIIQKNLPKDANEHLIGKAEVSYVDPKDGQTKKGIRIKPGLVIDPEYVTDKEELKEVRKEANDIGKAIVPTKDINKLTKDIIEISSKLKDKNIVGQAFAAYIAGKDPGLVTKMGEEIEFEGRKVNSIVALEHKLKLLTDAYRQAKGMRALTNTVQEHIEGLFRNPSTSFQNYKDTIDQMLYTRDLTQQRLFNTAEAGGFVPEFLMKEFGEGNQKIYDKLNYDEGEALSDQLLRG